MFIVIVIVILGLATSDHPELKFTQAQMGARVNR
jgi:hypothetical protein